MAESLLRTAIVKLINEFKKPEFWISRKKKMENII